MAIPHFLTKAYLSLEKFDPKSVAKAFYVAMKEFDLKSKNNMIDPNLIDEENIDNLDKTKISGEEELSDTLDKENEETETASMSCVSNFIHVLQICHLCFLKKIPPAMNLVASTPEVNHWFKSISVIAIRSRIPRAKCLSIETSVDFGSDDSTSSPEQKISKKDQVFINTMLK